MKNTMKRAIVLQIIVLTALTSSTGFASYAHAADMSVPSSLSQPLKGTRSHSYGKGIVGTVSATSGTNITLVDKHDKAYFVDAAKALITKDGAIIAVQNIKIGDTILARGAISGTNITAKEVVDGWSKETRKKSAFEGNRIAGTVLSIHGATFTLSNNFDAASATLHTVDASAAIIFKSTDGKAPANVTIADIKIGDKLLVQGALVGTTMNATHIMDGVPSAKVAKKFKKS